MALFVDGQLLNVNNPEVAPHLKPYVDEFLNFKQYAKKLGTLKFKRLNLYQEKDNRGSIEELAAPVLLKYHQTVYDPHTETNVEWRWTSSVPSKNRDGDFDFTGHDASEWIRNKTFVVTDVQQAFFLFAKSNIVNKYKELELMDSEKDADTYVAKQSKMASLDYFIFDEMSPLNLNPDALITMSRAWGIANADKKSKNQLKIALKNVILQGEKTGKKGIDAFRGMLNLDKKTKVKSFITRAKDEGWIGYDKTKLQYCYLNADKQPGEVIVETSEAQGDVDDILAEYLLSDDKLLQRFMQICQIKEPIELDIEPDSDDEKDTPPNKLLNSEYGDDIIEPLLRKPLMNKAIQLNEKLKTAGDPDIQKLVQSGFGTMSNKNLLDFIKQHRNYV